MAVSDITFAFHLPTSICCLPQESWEDEETESKPVEAKTAPTVRSYCLLITEYENIPYSSFRPQRKSQVRG